MLIFCPKHEHLVMLIVSMNAIFKWHFPVKSIVSLNAISSEVALSCEVAYSLPVKWLFSYEVA